MAAANVNGKGVKPHATGTVPVVKGSYAQKYAAKHPLADHFIGGNKLENALAGPVKDFVASHDGHTVITSVCTRLGPDPPSPRNSNLAWRARKPELTGNRS
jgi:acetyl-CoA carboxylase/biotin carboxylase 1